MKKLSTVLLLGLVLLCAAFAFTACASNNNPTPTTTVAPVTTTTSPTTYTVFWKNGDTVLETDLNVAVGTIPTYNGSTPTKAADAQYSYTFNGWEQQVDEENKTITFYAKYTSQTNAYTIVWKNGDTVMETDNNVPYGTMPTYNSAQPTKAETSQYTYTFSGWSPIVEPVTQSVTYQAQFTQTARAYTVIWKNGNTVLEADYNVPYGTIPTYNSAQPTKAETSQYTYTFSGWSPIVEPVTQSVTYQAQFTQTARAYTVIFYNEDGSTILDSVTVAYGSAAIYSKSTPQKGATAGYTYTFEKWVTTPGGTQAANLSGVAANLSVYASFTPIAKKVTVSIVSNIASYGSVSVSSLTNIPYGSSIVVNGNIITINGNTVTATPASSTAQHSYTFLGWTADTTVGNYTIITANFSCSVNSYTVTWKNGDSVLEVDENVAYGVTPVYNGETPTKAPVGESTYVFTGWLPTISAVTGNVTYTAQFTTKTNKHTVIFYDDDGVTELGRVLVGNGETATYPHALPTKAPTAQATYAFDKWVTAPQGNVEASFENITANKAVYAQYSATARTYTVTFYDWDGSLLDEQSVEYGRAATPPQEPYREGYRFEKWNSSYNNITEDLQITATYIRQFTVKFVDYDNSIIDLQLVDYGTDATKPNDPTRKNYSFVGWNTTFTNVVSDLTVKARYIRQYTVTFVDYDGTVISTGVVNSGDNATPPSNPVRVGYTFTSWNQSYKNIVSDMEIMAVYEINRYTVTFLDVDGSFIASITSVAHGTTVTPPETPDIYFDWSKTKAYRFTGWKDWNANQPIVGNIFITAEYSDEITDPIIAIETKEISKGTTTAEVSVYLCGSFENIYGMSLKLQYAEELVLSNGSVIINSKLVGSESTLNTENSLYELSWADGQGIDVSERLEVLTLTFSIDKYTDVGEYITELLDGTYIIGENLSKITPIVIVGHVVITE